MCTTIMFIFLSEMNGHNCSTYRTLTFKNETKIYENARMYAFFFDVASERQILFRQIQSRLTEIASVIQVSPPTFREYMKISEDDTNEFRDKIERSHTAQILKWLNPEVVNELFTDKVQRSKAYNFERKYDMHLENVSGIYSDNNLHCKPTREASVAFLVKTYKILYFLQLLMYKQLIKHNEVVVISVSEAEYDKFFLSPYKNALYRKCKHNIPMLHCIRTRKCEESEYLFSMIDSIANSKIITDEFTCYSLHKNLKRDFAIFDCINITHKRQEGICSIGEASRIQFYKYKPSISPFKIERLTSEQYKNLYVYAFKEPLTAFYPVQMNIYYLRAMHCYQFMDQRSHFHNWINFMHTKFTHDSTNDIPIWVSYNNNGSATIWGIRRDT